MLCCQHLSRCLLPALLLVAPSTAGLAQTPDRNAQPTSHPATVTALTELPPQILAQLRAVEDRAPHFDFPGYYAVVAFVEQHDGGPGTEVEPQVVRDWQSLLQRPNDFRGLPVTIAGRVGLNKDPYRSAQHPELGLLYQLELYQPGEPMTVTVVCTEDVSHLPVESQITITGYFVMIRTFPGKRRETNYAALLVAKGPTRTTQTAPQAPRSVFRWEYVVAAVFGGLVLAWFLLRAANARRGPRNIRTLRASQSAKRNLADDLERWSHEDSSFAGDNATDSGAGDGDGDGNGG